MNAPALPGRPRLQPGVPAGGIAALAVAGVMLVWGLVAGGNEEQRDFAAPRAPQAPHAPHAPLAPLAPIPPLPHISVGHEDIQGVVAEAMRNVDVEAIRRDAMAAVEDARREMEAMQTEMQRSTGQRATAAGQFHGTDAIDAVYEVTGGVKLVNLRGDLVISAGAPGQVRLMVEEGGRKLNTVVADGQLTVTGMGDQSPVTAILEIPADSHLFLAAFSGDLSLDGSFHGDLTADIMSGDIAAEHLASATIQIHNRGDVSVDRVDGKLGLSVYGSGDFSANQVGSLALELPGRSSISIERVADGAFMSIPGRAEVHIGEVSGPVKAAFMGSGEITVERGRAESLNVAMLGNGDFTFTGTAVDPELFMGGSGTILVPNIEGTPRIHRAGSGDIVTKH